MDFARKLLEKYGWKEGSGLGRKEDGIAEALRPKLKRSVTGVGHDAAAEHNDHWWSALYDKAAANVQVEDNASISTKERDAFQISSKSWKIGKRKKANSSYMESFVRTAVLASGGLKTERVRCDSESEEETALGPMMTDEQLYAACGGRTAHKGARHGLRAAGKLSRIEQQEQALLKLPQYKGYSQAKMSDSQEVINHKETVPEDLSFEDDTVRSVKKQKKKKKQCKRATECQIDEIELKVLDIEKEDEILGKVEKGKDEKNEIAEVQQEVIEDERILKNKRKQPKEENEELNIVEKGKKKKEIAEVQQEVIEEESRLKNKRKKIKVEKEENDELNLVEKGKDKKKENTEVLEEEKRLENKKKKSTEKNGKLNEVEKGKKKKEIAEVQQEVIEEERRLKNKTKKTKEEKEENDKLNIVENCKDKKKENTEVQQVVMEERRLKNRKKKTKEENSEDLMENTELAEPKRKKKKKIVEENEIVQFVNKKKNKLK